MFLLADVAAADKKIVTGKIKSPTCSELIENLGFKGSLTDQEILRTAFKSVMDSRQRKKEATKNLFTGPIDGDAEGNRIFASLHDLIPRSISFGSVATPIILEDVTHAREVFRFTTSEGVRYFRPLRGTLDAPKARKTLAASILNRQLGLQTVPLAEWGTVNGKIGAISHEAPGIGIVSQLHDLLTSKKINSKSYADVSAFEFLVGNSDGASRNLQVDMQGNLTCFDHDLAFINGLINANSPNKEAGIQVGERLPEQYTVSFYEALKRLSPQTIYKKLDTLLSDEEIEGLLLRREIILKDVELRGSSTVLF